MDQNPRLAVREIYCARSTAGDPKTLGVDSPFFSAIVHFQEKKQPFLRVFVGFPERRIPGKNGGAKLP